ncbi:MAG: hypothetical protein ACRC62_05685 [Microcoleus sp.]
MNADIFKIEKLVLAIKVSLLRLTAHSCQLNKYEIINCPLSTVNCQLSTV